MCCMYNKISGCMDASKWNLKGKIEIIKYEEKCMLQKLC